MALQIQQAILQAKLDLGLVRKMTPEAGQGAPPPPASALHPKDPAERARVIDFARRFIARARRTSDGDGGPPAPGGGDSPAGGPEGAAGPRDPATD